MSKVLMKGNEAIGEAAIRAGCLNYFAYPITPQSEVAGYLSRRMPEVDGVFLQGESEVAVSYMIWGNCFRTFTDSAIHGLSESLNNREKKTGTTYQLGELKILKEGRKAA